MLERAQTKLDEYVALRRTELSSGARTFIENKLLNAYVSLEGGDRVDAASRLLEVVDVNSRDVGSVEANRALTLLQELAQAGRSVRIRRGPRQGARTCSSAPLAPPFGCGPAPGVW